MPKVKKSNLKTEPFIVIRNKITDEVERVVFPHEVRFGVKSSADDNFRKKPMDADGNELISIKTIQDIAGTGTVFASNFQLSASTFGSISSTDLSASELSLKQWVGLQNTSGSIPGNVIYNPRFTFQSYANNLVRPAGYRVWGVSNPTGAGRNSISYGDGADSEKMKIENAGDSDLAFVSLAFSVRATLYQVEIRMKIESSASTGSPASSATVEVDFQETNSNLSTGKVAIANTGALSDVESDVQSSTSTKAITASSMAALNVGTSYAVYQGVYEPTNGVKYASIAVRKKSAPYQGLVVDYIIVTPVTVDATTALGAAQNYVRGINESMEAELGSILTNANFANERIVTLNNGNQHVSPSGFRLTRVPDITNITDNNKREAIKYNTGSTAGGNFKVLELDATIAYPTGSNHTMGVLSSFLILPTTLSASADDVQSGNGSYTIAARVKSKQTADVVTVSLIAHEYFSPPPVDNNNRSFIAVADSDSSLSNDADTSAISLTTVESGSYGNVFIFDGDATTGTHQTIQVINMTNTGDTTADTKENIPIDMNDGGSGDITDPEDNIYYDIIGTYTPNLKTKVVSFEIVAEGLDGTGTGGLLVDYIYLAAQTIDGSIADLLAQERAEAAKDDAIKYTQGINDLLGYEIGSIIENATFAKESRLTLTSGASHIRPSSFRLIRVGSLSTNPDYASALGLATGVGGNGKVMTLVPASASNDSNMSIMCPPITIPNNLAGTTASSVTQEKSGASYTFAIRIKSIKEDGDSGDYITVSAHAHEMTGSLKEGCITFAKRESGVDATTIESDVDFDANFTKTQILLLNSTDPDDTSSGSEQIPSDLDDTSETTGVEHQFYDLIGTYTPLATTKFAAFEINVAGMASTGGAYIDYVYVAPQTIDGNIADELALARSDAALKEARNYVRGINDALDTELGSVLTNSNFANERVITLGSGNEHVAPASFRLTRVSNIKITNELKREALKYNTGSAAGGNFKVVELDAELASDTKMGILSSFMVLPSTFLSEATTTSGSNSSYTVAARVKSKKDDDQLAVSIIAHEYFLAPPVDNSVPPRSFMAVVDAGSSGISSTTVESGSYGNPFVFNGSSTVGTHQTIAIVNMTDTSDVTAGSSETLPIDLDNADSDNNTATGMENQYYDVIGTYVPNSKTKLVSFEIVAENMDTSGGGLLIDYIYVAPQTIGGSIAEKLANERLFSQNASGGYPNVVYNGFFNLRAYSTDESSTFPAGFRSWGSTSETAVTFNDQEDHGDTIVKMRSSDISTFAMLSNAFPVNSDLYSVFVRVKSTNSTINNIAIKAFELIEPINESKLAIADLTLSNFTNSSIADVQQSSNTVSLLELHGDETLDDIDGISDSTYTEISGSYEPNEDAKYASIAIMNTNATATSGDILIERLLVSPAVFNPGSESEGSDTKQSTNTNLIYNGDGKIKLFGLRNPKPAGWRGTGDTTNRLGYANKSARGRARATSKILFAGGNGSGTVGVITSAFETASDDYVITIRLKAASDMTDKLKFSIIEYDDQLEDKKVCIGPNGVSSYAALKGGSGSASVQVGTRNIVLHQNNAPDGQTGSYAGYKRTTTGTANRLFRTANLTTVTDATAAVTLLAADEFVVYKFDYEPTSTALHASICIEKINSTIDVEIDFVKVKVDNSTTTSRFSAVRGVSLANIVTGGGGLLTTAFGSEFDDRLSTRTAGNFPTGVQNTEVTLTNIAGIATLFTSPDIDLSAVGKVNITATQQTTNDHRVVVLTSKTVNLPSGTGTGTITTYHSQLTAETLEIDGGAISQCTTITATGTITAGAITSVGGPLKVKQTAYDSSSTGLWIVPTTTSTNEWRIFYGGTTNDRLKFANNTNVRGFIGNTGTSIKMNHTEHFTGQHRVVAQHDADSAVLIDPVAHVGLIVVSTGEYNTRWIDDNESQIDINNTHPTVKLSNKRMQKSAFGVISNKEDIDDNTGGIQLYHGNFVSNYSIEEYGEPRLIVNSLGEGAIWVCNINGNLENGDYITTCEIPGLGMKQDDDLLHNYTVAKITQDCNFRINSAKYDVVEFEFEGKTYRKAFVGCTYHCG